VRLAVAVDDGKQFRFRDEVDLVESHYGRGLDGLHEVQKMPIAGPFFDRYIDDERHKIDFAHRVERDIDHAHVHTMRGLVHPRRVDEHHLPAGIVFHAHDPSSCGLRLVGHDRQLVADNPIQQRRFSSVRSTDERNKT
jgi:hypothetical protein